MEKVELDSLLMHYKDSFKAFKPQKAVHYCNLDTFFKIINPYVSGKTLERSDNGTKYKAKYVTFFATDLKFLNDREEYKIGKNYVESVAGDLEKSADSEELFVACFCSDTDNLTQWKYYGKEAGCGLAVEFDTENVFLNYCDICECGQRKKEADVADVEIEKESYPKRHDILFMPFNVHYFNRKSCASKDEQKKAEQIINKLLPKEHLLNSVTEQTAKLGIIPYIKHKAFEDERESRIILYNCQHGKKLCSSIKYRPGKVIKPFVEMCMFYGNNKAATSIPIKSITIGPDRDQDLLFSSIYHFVEQDVKLKGINLEGKHSIVTSDGITITKSTTPFRS